MDVNRLSKPFAYMTSIELLSCYSFVMIVMYSMVP